MIELSLDWIAYQIFSDTKAIIKSCNHFATSVFFRNCVSFDGNCVKVAHLSARGFGKTILVPYSIHTIFCPTSPFQHVLELVVFEFGSELRSIAPSTFQQSQLKSIFLPQSVRFVGQSAFSRCDSLDCVHFDSHSSLRQFQSLTFPSLQSLSRIIIPTCVKQIHNSTFQGCKCLRSVTFAFPSECWYFALGAFQDCVLITSVFLPPSVEVIDPNTSCDVGHIPYYSVPNNSRFCVENDCLPGANGRQLIQYQGMAKTFSVNHDISVLSPGSFMLSSSLITLVFESQSCLKSLPAFCFCRCAALRSLEVPKSVHVICESCFETCSAI
jgi:hypothetical protein